MSAQAPETADQEVAAPSPDAGKTVWCENGCGNRILDRDERIPFPCPTGCGGAMTEEKPQAAQGKTQSIELPTVGRIVHVLVAPNVIRPAIVSAFQEDGTLALTVFRHPGDPVFQGLDRATNTAVCGYGVRIGGWFWPARAPKETFEAVLD